MPEETLGQRVRRLRGPLALRSLARRSGVHYTTLCRIENQAQAPRGNTLERLAPALGTTVEELTDGVRA